MSDFALEAKRVNEVRPAKNKFIYLNNSKIIIYLKVLLNVPV